MSMKTAVKWAGGIVTVLALAFVAYALHGSLDLVRDELLSLALLWRVIVWSALYGLFFQCVALAWFYLTHAIDVAGPHPLGALAIYGRTQIYKYLPSNVLHMAGRYAMSRGAGISHAALVFAQVGEISIILLSAATLSMALAHNFLASVLLEHGLANPQFYVAGITLGFGVLFVALTTYLTVKYGHDRMRMMRFALLAFALYAVFFLGNGILVYLILIRIDPAAAVSVYDVIGIATLAWLLGFIVPGAPGGLGVREASLIGGLTLAGAPEAAAAVALLHRIVTISGDGIVALVELAARRGRLLPSG